MKDLFGVTFDFHKRSKPSSNLLFTFQQCIEIRKRPVNTRIFFLAARALIVIPFGGQVSRVFLVVTVNTQQLPVAPVGRIVVVVVVLVVNRKLSKFFA